MNQQPKRANSAYKTTAVSSAGKGQVLIMLYEAAIQNCKKAIQAIDQANPSAKGVHIGKAHDILNELNATLDFGIGGNIAHDLERLYNFMVEQLVKANIENAKEPIESVQKLLETLLEGWRVAVEKAKAEQVIKG